MSNQSIRLSLAAALLATSIGCGGAPAPVDEDGFSGDEEKEDSAGVPLPLSHKKIASASRFDRLAFSSGLIVQGKSVKFLIDNRDPAKPKTTFVNANYKTADGRTPDAAKYHYFFAKTTLPQFSETIASFNHATYETQEKRYFAGTIQSYRAGADGKPIYGIQFYPQDVVNEERIQKAVELVKRSFKILRAKVAFVATGPQQTTARVKSAIEALGIQVLTIDQILGAMKFVPMHLGEAWGVLRIFPDSDSLTALDIAVFDELPLDLAVVAGVITRAFQDASSHVNLKSKERNTPNMVLRDASPTHRDLAPFKDKPVHLRVKADGFTIEPTTLAIVEQKLRERTNKPWSPLAYEPESRLLSFDAMCPTDARRCLDLGRRIGSKAANLGFLTNAAVLGRTSNAGSLSASLGYDLVPHGIGVPIQFYQEFVAHPPNAALKSALTELIDAEKAGRLSARDRVTKLKSVQELFYKAAFPAGMVERIVARLAEALPGIKKIKVRSSANAEDIPNFDGAGLYDSFSANLGKVDNADGSCALKVDGDGDGVETKLEMDPKTLGCAMKGVFASVWNKRAIEERSYARLDHATAGMGLAIVPKYKNESPIAANAVVVTRVIGGDAVYGYSFSTQKGNNLVTNPTPGTLSETLVAAFLSRTEPATFIVTRYATPTAGQPPLAATVLQDAQMSTMLTIAQTVETAYCRAKPGYYPQNCASVTADPSKPTALDMEFKFLENGQFIAKQVREFSGR